MKRKEFLKKFAGGVAGGVLVMLGASCRSSSSPEIPNENRRSFTSSNVDNHTHTVTINRSEIESPPQNGITKTTSSGGGHTHSFTMTQLELQNVNDGQTVTVSDSIVLGHTHTYQISKWF